MLILAVVAISAVNGDGIISKAKLARTNYQAAQTEENTMLGNYLLQIEDVNSNGNKKSGSVPYSLTLNDMIEHNIIYQLIYNEDGCENQLYFGCNSEEFVKYIGFNSLNEYKNSEYYIEEDFLINNTLNENFVASNS